MRPIASNQINHLSNEHLGKALNICPHILIWPFSLADQFPHFPTPANRSWKSCNSQPGDWDYISTGRHQHDQNTSSCKMRHFLLLIPCLCLVSAVELDQGGLDALKGLANVKVGGEAGLNRWATIPKLTQSWSSCRASWPVLKYKIEIKTFLRVHSYLFLLLRAAVQNFRTLRELLLGKSNAKAHGIWKTSKNLIWLFLNINYFYLINI